MGRLLHPAWVWPVVLACLFGGAALLSGPWGLAWLGAVLILLPVVAFMGLAMLHYKGEKEA